MPNFAANLSMMFQEQEFLDRFGAAAQAGFRGVEYLFPYAYEVGEIEARLTRHRLTQVLFNLPPGDWGAGDRGLAAVPGREVEFAESVERALDYARPLRCRLLHAMAGLLPEGADAEEAEQIYVANLRRGAEQAARDGVTLLIEPINTRDMPGYFLTTVAQARRVIAAVGAPNLFLQMDLYHRQIMGGDLAECLHANWDVIRHFQIAGVPGRHEPDIGEVRFDYLFELIDAHGYEGWIGCEYRPRAGTVEGLGWAARYGIGGAGANRGEAA